MINGLDERSPIKMGESSIAGDDRPDCGFVMKTQQHNLAERTAQFGEAIIEFCLNVALNPVVSPLTTQLVKAGTSVGANYCEADDAESKKDFRHKIGICRKEARETKYWLRMLAKALTRKIGPVDQLAQEAKELHLIFCAIIRTTDRNLRSERDERMRVNDQ